MVRQLIALRFLEKAQATAIITTTPSALTSWEVFIGDYPSKA
jgi:hypothetical protein